MKAIVYDTSWCAACRHMADFLRQQYADMETQFVPVDKMPTETQGQIVAAPRRLTWTDELPMTEIGASVVVGTDYAALIALLEPDGRPPAGGSAQHRHEIAEAGA
jgi:hypothetical protein